MAIPMGILLRDVLGIAQNLREVKYILRKGYVKVDHKSVRYYRYPIGLMDIIELVITNKFFRILPGRMMPLELHEIVNKKEYYIKPLLIKNKVMVSGSRLQLTTHDGRNFVFKKDDKLSSLKPGDTLVYDFKGKKIKDYIKFDVDALALVYWGGKKGFIGRIKEIKKIHSLKPRAVILEADGEIVETVSKYVFPIGVKSPVIDFGGVSGE